MPDNLMPAIEEQKLLDALTKMLGTGAAAAQCLTA